MMRKYDEFRHNAVRKILDEQPVASLSRELGSTESPLHKWQRVKLETSVDWEKEVVELKKRLREVCMECDVLIKATLIFGRVS